MVVETRRGKRKENPTEEEAPRVKFAKTGSGENVEKTTTEESETRAVEIVESTAKTTDESTAKTTDESTAKTKTTDVSTEKTRKDSTENTAEITEPSNVAAEAAPTTLNKGPGDEENEETASGDEENEETASGDEENEETASGDEVNEKTAYGDEENEKTASGDGENEDSEEEPPDGENEVNAHSEEEQANVEGEDEANENGNPLEPQDLDGNEAPEAIKPTRMFFNPSEYKKKIKLGTRCMIASTIKTLSNLKPKLSNAEWNWFTEYHYKKNGL
ncbi:mitotic apparatus protein p62-like [Brassica napus]|uniref:mitotic apparatus protein p62-like n=1 Tax=Brassica napus TaxID=3708 RepID=UPI0020789AA8|nr:mitotic apparatus protein p62-like [Brassica napus]